MDTEALLKKAEYKSKIGRLNEARDLYLKVIRKDPNHARAYHGLGTIYSEDFNEKQRAMEFFRKALSLDRNIPEAHFGYAMLLTDKGNPDGLKHFEYAYHLNPHLPGLLNRMGTAYLKFGRTQVAINSLHHAIKQNPEILLPDIFFALQKGKNLIKTLGNNMLK